MRLQHVSVAFPPGAYDAVRAFYGGVLGLREVEVPPKLEPGRFVWFDGGGGLELHLLPGEVAPGDQHFCLVVEDDLEGLGARLAAAGYEPTETTEAMEIVGRPRFFCRDPFGNLIEFCRFER